MIKLMPTFILLFILAFETEANNSVEKINRLSIINHNWSTLNQQQYIDNLVACELTLQNHKWSKNIWPKTNIKTKPLFSQVVNLDNIQKKVYGTLKMQSVLENTFNISITQEMIQDDIDRMIFNSKDFNGLKALFDLFDNNPNTIAQCISIPYLVKLEIQNNYNTNIQIHSNSRELAKNNLTSFIDGAPTESLKSQVNNTLIEVKQNPSIIDSQMLIGSENESYKINKNQFLELIKQTKIGQLQEDEQAFNYSNLIEENGNYFKLKTLRWNKDSFGNWLNKQPSQAYQSQTKTYSLSLSNLKNHHNSINTKNTWLETTVGLNAPEGREKHTAIWTGNEMIIWGGRNPVEGNFNTGSLYDPVTDRWSSTNISSRNLPRERHNHTAIWTGQEMIIWGGWEFATYTEFFNTGGRYNPMNDTWLPINNSELPIEGRVFHTAIWSGSEMIIWGGIGSGLLTPGARYNPASDSWLPISNGQNSLESRSNHTAVWTGSEMIIWGGFSGPDTFYNSGARYNPITDNWSPISMQGDVPIGRSFHTAVWSGSEMIVWGGSSDINNQGLGSGGRYNPENDTWDNGNIDSNAINGRYWHSVIWTGFEMIVWGGNNDSNSGGRYNLSTESWMTTSVGSNVPSGRIHHTAIWTGSEMIIWGGFDGVPPNYYPVSTGIYFPYNTYSIGGNLSGLNGGQVTLKNNGNDFLELNSNAYFEFDRNLIEGSDYEVTIHEHPDSPPQTCTVNNGKGKILAEVTDLIVTCSLGDLIFKNNFEEKE